MDANKLLELKQFIAICSRNDYSIMNKDVHELIVELQQATDRERVLRDALERVRKDLIDSHNGGLIHVSALQPTMTIIKEALEESK